MAQIPLTIPNAQVSRVVNALCIAGGYSGDPNDNAARNAFAVAHLAKYVRDTVQRIEHGQAIDAMYASAPAPPPPPDVT